MMMMRIMPAAKAPPLLISIDVCAQDRRHALRDRLTTDSKAAILIRNFYTL